jgi:hypothetical protein
MGRRPFLIARAPIRGAINDELRRNDAHGNQRRRPLARAQRHLRSDKWQHRCICGVKQENAQRQHYERSFPEQCAEPRYEVIVVRSCTAVCANRINLRVANLRQGKKSRNCQGGRDEEYRLG